MTCALQTIMLAAAVLKTTLTASQLEDKSASNNHFLRENGVPTAERPITEAVEVHSG